MKFSVIYCKEFFKYFLWDYILWSRFFLNSYRENIVIKGLWEIDKNKINVDFGVSCMFCRENWKFVGILVYVVCLCSIFNYLFYLFDWLFKNYVVSVLVIILFLSVLFGYFFMCVYY